MRFSLGSSDVLTRVAAALANGRERTDYSLDKLLRSGILDPVKDDQGPTGGASEPGEKEKYVVNPQ